MSRRSIILQPCRIWIAIGVLGLFSIHATAVDALYTNAADGATIVLSQDISVDSPFFNTSFKAGISFDDGSGNGTVTGAGTLTVRNISTTGQRGAAGLYGIEASMVTNEATGTITVLNDQSAFLANSGAAYAHARGVHGNIYGNVNQDISATATGGSISNNNAFTYADAKAFSYGINGTVSSNLSNTMVAMATGGMAYSSSNVVDAAAFSYGIKGSIGNNLSGTVETTATGGTAFSSNNNAFASAYASGITGIGGDLAGTITAMATGGTAATVTGNAEASAQAYGVNGATVAVSNFNGAITATAVAGLEIVTGTTNLSRATAIGISATDQLYLNASGGAITAQALPQSGFAADDLPTNSIAASIWGGALSDTVLLSGISLTGDINLNGGANTLTILGDTHIDGDIYSAGGLLDFDIDAGVLTFRGPTTISDLMGDLNISSAAGLGFLLTAGDTNTILTVNGGVAAQPNATLSAAPAPGQSIAGIIGETFEVLLATNGIAGTFVESTASLLSFGIAATSNTVSVTPTGLKYQDTPAPSATLAAVDAVNIVMNNLSVHTGNTRSSLRNKKKPEAVGIKLKPLGVAGPTNDVDKLLEGQYVAFVRQFNDLGGLDDDGAVSGYDWKTHGFLIGFEKLGKENVLLGVAFGSAWTDLDGNRGSGGGSSDMLTLAAYCNYFTDRWYAEGGLNYGHTMNRSLRIDALGNGYSGEFDSILVSTWMESGYAFPINESWSMEPYGRLSYIKGQHDGYTETGAPMPMIVDDVETDNLITELGMRGINNWELENGSVLRLEFLAGWQYEHMDDEVTANTSVASLSQQAHSPDADSSAFVLGMNGDWYLNDMWSVGLEYKPTFSRDWYNHSINGMLRYRF